MLGNFKLTTSTKRDTPYYAKRGTHQWRISEERLYPSIPSPSK